MKSTKEPVTYFYDNKGRYIGAKVNWEEFDKLSFDQIKSAGKIVTMDYGKIEQKVMAHVANSFPKNARDGSVFTDPYGVTWMWDAVLGKWAQYKTKHRVLSNGQPIVYDDQPSNWKPGHIIDNQEKVFSYQKVQAASGGCKHVWKEYVGLTQRYKYCEKCDEKTTS